MYVREACRLLQKSIIFVESEDVELDDNEEEMDRGHIQQREEGSRGEQAPIFVVCV